MFHIKTSKQLARTKHRKHSVSRRTTYTFPVTRGESARGLVTVGLDVPRKKDPKIALGMASIVSQLMRENIQVTYWGEDILAEDFSTEEVFTSVFFLFFFFVDQRAQFLFFKVVCKIMKESQKFKLPVDFATGVFVWNDKIVNQICDSLKKYKFPGRIILGGNSSIFSTKNLIFF